MEQVEHPKLGSMFDITMSIWDSSTGPLHGSVEYNTDLFDRTTIVRLIGHYQRLLEAMTQDVGRRLSSLPLLTAQEHRQMVHEWNVSEPAYTKEKCIQELFEEQVERTPDATAVIFGEQVLSYSQLNERTNQLAHYLIETKGVKPDVFVGLCVDRSVEMVVGLLGILKAGGAYVPLDPEYPEARLTYMVEDSKCVTVLTQRELSSASYLKGGSTICLDDSVVSGAIGGYPMSNPQRVEPGASRLAYVIYTSGSTGTPKGVQIEHRSLVNCLSAMRQKPGMSAEDVVLAVTSISFDPHTLEIFLPLMIGARVVIASKDDAVSPVRLQELIEHHEVSVMQGTPSRWKMLLNAGWEMKRRFKVLCGGEAMDVSLRDMLLRFRGVELWNMYGPTETTVWSAVNRITLEDTVFYVGSPIPNMRY